MVRLLYILKLKNRVNQVELKNVFFVENLRNKILCFSKIAKVSEMKVFENKIEIYSKANNELQAVAGEVNDLYF